MSDDPVRWKDGGDPPAGLRALLTEGRSVPPMPADVRAALRAGLPAPIAAPGSAAPGAAASSSAAWVAGVAGVLAVAIAAIVWTTRPPSTPAGPAVGLSSPSASVPPTVASSSAVATTAPTASSAGAEVPSSLPPPEEVRGAPVQSPRRTAPSAQPAVGASAVPSATPTAAATSSLAEESALIGKARAELVASPAAALVDIDDHARRFAHGELVAEREYLRVSALRRLGRNDEARARGKRYLTLFPTSPYVAPVRTILAEIGEP